MTNSSHPIEIIDRLKEIVGVRSYIEDTSHMDSYVNDIMAKLDGSLSAEHGVGLVKKQELKKYKSHVELKFMREIKKNH